MLVVDQDMKYWLSVPFLDPLAT